MAAEPAAKRPKTASNSCENTDDRDEILKVYSDKRKSVCSSVMGFKFNKKRVRLLTNEGEISQPCQGVVYWMWREQRVQDNWALLYAQRLALKQQAPLFVCFCLPASYLDATIRQYNFMIKGLQHVEKELQVLDISFHLLLGEPDTVLQEFVKSRNIGGIVADFCPLRLPTEWMNKVIKAIPKTVPICQVDAHNIIPCWHASPKLEYAARTIRPKIHKVLSEFLTEFPPVIVHPHASKERSKPTNWKVDKFITVDRDVGEVEWAKPGTAEGLLMLESFCRERLKQFHTSRNYPTEQALSNLSPWFHTGQISTQRAILKVREFRGKFRESVEAFIEECVVRRELSDNFCFYNFEKYDSIEGTNDWAKKTLRDHAGDKREYVYSREQLEKGKTHDDLWNASQRQLVREGKLHGFLRMYWAKKMLEWTESPEAALRDAIYFNDKYALDGIDPNGYVGCMWSICGTHDQGWEERPVFGKIRFMNYKGCQRKFDVKEFVKRYKP